MRVAAVTFANGGGNIGIYAPLFATSDATHLTVTVLTFYVLLAIWCFLGCVSFGLRNPLTMRARPVCIPSRGFVPAGRALTRTSLSAGVGLSISLSCKTSGGPYSQ